MEESKTYIARGYGETGACLETQICYGWSNVETQLHEWTSDRNVLTITIHESSLQFEDKLLLVLERGGWIIKTAPFLS